MVSFLTVSFKQSKYLYIDASGTQELLVTIGLGQKGAKDLGMQEKIDEDVLSRLFYIA